MKINSRILFSIFSIFIASIFFAFIWNRELFFEFGYYLKSVRSILEDFDFNIINQFSPGEVNYLATSTGNHPTFIYPTISAYLAPFFVFTKMLASDLSDKTFGYTHIFANIFYLLLGFIFLLKINQLNSKKYFLESTLGIILGSSLIWYSLFESTTTNTFAFTYSILAYYLFKLIMQQTFQHRYKYLFFSLVVSLGFIIRLELTWLSFLIPYLLLTESNNKIKDFISSCIGFSIPLIGYFSIEYFQFNEVTIPFIGHLQSTSNISPVPFIIPYFKNYLFGPNGYLITSPIFIFIFIQLILELKENFHYSNERLYQLIWPTILSISIICNWLFPMGYQGRYQLAFLIIYILALQDIFLRINNRKIIYSILIGCSFISLYAMTCTLAADGVEAPMWLFKYSYGLNYFWGGLQFLIERFNQTNLINAFSLILFFSPLIILCSFILYFALEENSFKSNRILISFFIFGLVVFSIFSTLNAFYNPKNFEKLKAENFYQDKAIIKNGHLAYLESIYEVSNQVKVFALINKRCDLFNIANEIRHQFYLKNENSILTAPVDLKTKILLNEDYTSPVEFPIIKSYIDANRNNCP